ncbi:hypothetical protein AWB70_01176 [Caballeronia cordobensis]|uniref:Uncharacterized protein n=1 Tax=Caballeronia cordobensis TaxID=1353886 RepID=A0A158FR27_CABCO|nr:hypothetical protein AWB70_01176 [Caballeronia cordobensis]
METVPRAQRRARGESHAAKMRGVRSIEQDAQPSVQ